MDFDPVAYINEPRWRSSVYGLERIRALMERLDNPERSLAFIHVAGTNGKGSTCAYLSHILQAAGYRTGLFTSPIFSTSKSASGSMGQTFPLMSFCTLRFG